METINEVNDREEMVRQYHRGILRKLVILAVLVAGIVLMVGAMALTVYDGLTLSEAYGVIWAHITGQEFPLRSEYWWADRYIWNIAMLHAVAAIVCGAGLACCGSLMQSLMSNPLADPYSTGISSGACLGAMAAIIMGVSMASLSGSAGTAVNAFVGAMVPAALIVVISERIRMTPATLILIGTALSMFFGALMSFMMVSTDSDTLQEAYLWQVGNFGNLTWSAIPIMVSVTAVGSALVMMLTSKLNVMSLGDTSAQSLGIDVRRFRTLAITLMAVMTAALVAFVGVIGFVGLVCPHIVRLLTGSDNKYVIPLSMALAVLLMLVACYLSLSFSSLPVGVVISALGAPIFFLMIVMSKNSGKGAIY